MNSVLQFGLKFIRKITTSFKDEGAPKFHLCIKTPQETSNAIYSILESGEPCMIARFGSTELNLVLNYLSVKQGAKPIDYFRGKCYQWWWNQLGIEQIQSCSGFFPCDETYIERFCNMVIDDAKQIDMLAHWRPLEWLVAPQFYEIPKCFLLFMEPYWSEIPWTRYLEGKRVLVVHPFAELIEKQYIEKRTILFDNKEVLPLFNLRTVKAVQSLGGDGGHFSNWFEALDWMRNEMDKEPYDVALIGCGAYGLPLAAYSKRTGHQAIHLAGALQLLFGIRGNRWDNPEFGSWEFGKNNQYKTLFNTNWVYPEDCYKPKNAKQVEGACYWK